MYSAVLMLALTAGSETADFGRNRCSAATCGKTVVAAPSCSRASSCASSCHARTKLFGNRCSHSCAASSCSTTKVHAAPSCSKSHGCSASHGCSGGLFSRLRSRCSSSCAVSTGCSTGTSEKKSMKEPEKVKGPMKTGAITAPATIIVNLPAGARLIVDGTPTNSVSDRRVLLTPELDFGTTYVYTMQVEIVRDGRTVAQEQQVNVRGGETTTVQFQFPNQGVASR